MVAYRYNVSHGSASTTPGYTFAHQVSFDSEIRLVGVECAISGNTTCSVYIWNTSGTLLASRNGTSVNGRLDFTTPYTLSANTSYVIGYYSANGQDYVSSVTKPHTHTEELASGPTLTVHAAIYNAGDSSAYPSTAWAGEWNHIYHAESANIAPNAPTGLAPNSTHRDPRISQDFTWTHNDPDGNAQSQYQIRYRLAGAASWTELSAVSSATSSHTFAADTFTLTEDYEWAVRTYDGSLWGPYSATATFFAASSSWVEGTITSSSTQSGIIPGAGLDFSTDYIYEVRTADAGGFGPWSVADAFSVGPDNIPPTITPFTTTGVTHPTGTTSVQLEADVSDPSTGQTVTASFELTRSTPSGFTPVTLTSTSVATPVTNSRRSVTFTGLKPGTYSWTAWATDSAGGTSASSTARTFTISNVAPSAPTSFTAPTSGSIYDVTGNVTHNAGSDPEGVVLQYELEYQANTGASWVTLAGLSTALTRSIDFSSYPNSTTARVRVRSFDGVDYSPYLTSSTFTVFHNTAPTVSAVTPDGTAFASTGPTLEVSVTDPDTQTLSVTAEVWDESATTLLWTYTEPLVGPVSSATVGFNPPPTEGNFQWRVRANDTVDNSAWTTFRTYIQEKLPTFLGGSDPVGDVLVGAAEADAVYLGNDLVWERRYYPPEGLVALFNVVTLPSGWVLCDGTNGTPDMRDLFVVGSGSSYTLGAVGGANTVALTNSELANHSHNASSSNTGAHTHSTSSSTGATHSHGVSVGSHSHSHNVTVGAGSQVSTTGNTFGAVGQGSSTKATGNASTGTDHGTSPSNLSGNHTHTSNADGTHSHSASLTSAGSGLAHENRPPYLALYYGMAGAKAELGAGVIMMSDAGSISGWTICNGTGSTPNLINRFPLGAGLSYALNAIGGSDTVALSLSEMPSHNHGVSMSNGGSHGHASDSDGSHSHNTNFSTHGTHSHNYSGVNIVNTNIGGGNNSVARIPNTLAAVGGGDGSHNYTHSIQDIHHTHNTIDASSNHAHSISSSSEGSGTAHENRPPYRATNFFRADDVLEELPVGIVAMFYGATAPAGWSVETSYTDRFPVGAGGSYAVASTGGSNAVTLTLANLPSHTHNDSSTGSAGTHSGHTLISANMSHSHSGGTSNHGNHTHSATQPTSTKNFVLGNWTGTYTSTSATTTGSHSHTHNATGGTSGGHNHVLTSGGSHGHTVSVGSAGSGLSHENRPPYRALLFIIKDQ